MIIDGKFVIQNYYVRTIEILFPRAGVWSYVLVFKAVNILAVPLIACFARMSKGHGVPEVMQAVMQRGGKIRPRVAITKPITAALCMRSTVYLLVCEVPH